jgi:hypothetical protein
MHVDAPGSIPVFVLFPAAQMSQSLLSFPSIFEYLPGSQSLHFATADVMLYLPTPHWMHSLHVTSWENMLYLPGLHWLQIVAPGLSPEFVIDPDGHSRHWLLALVL